MLKIQGGKYKRRSLKKPKSARALQAKLRQHIFDYLRDFTKDAEVLDLFAGGGTFGFEALSRGAKSVTFVEKNKAAIKIIEQNAQFLGVTDKVSVVKADVNVYLNQAVYNKKARFNIIFLDPPFAKLLKFTPEQQRRYIRSLVYKSYKLLKKQSVIILKIHKRLPVTLMENMAVLDTYTLGVNKLYYFVQPQFITQQNKKMLLFNNTDNKKRPLIGGSNTQKRQFKNARNIAESDNDVNEQKIYEIIKTFEE